MSRAPFNPLPPNPFTRRQTPQLNEVMQRLSEQSLISGVGETDVAQGSNGITVDYNPQKFRDDWFWAVIVDAGADGTPESSLDKSAYFFNSVLTVQVSGATSSNQTLVYMDTTPTARLGVGTNISEVSANTDNLTSIPAGTDPTVHLPSSATIVKVYSVNAMKQNGSASDPANAVYIIDPGGTGNIPVGMYPGMIYQVGAANTGVWDWEHAHSLLSS